VSVRRHELRRYPWQVRDSGQLLLVVAALLWGLARWLGVEPAWWQNVRRTLAEASWHAEAAWADFADWIRVGR